MPRRIDPPRAPDSPRYRRPPGLKRRTSSFRRARVRATSQEDLAFIGSLPRCCSASQTRGRRLRRPPGQGRDVGDAQASSMEQPYLTRLPHRILLGRSARCEPYGFASRRARACPCKSVARLLFVARTPGSLARLPISWQLAASLSSSAICSCRLVMMPSPSDGAGAQLVSQSPVDAEGGR